LKQLIGILICFFVPVFSGEIVNLTMDRDAAFQMDRLRPSEGMEMIVDFEVIGDTIWVLEIGKPDGYETVSQLTKIELTSGQDQVTSVKRRKEGVNQNFKDIMSLSQTGDQLSVINLDIGKGTQILTMAPGDRLKMSQSLQHCLATHMHAFANDRCLVKADRMTSEMTDFSGEGGDVLLTEAYAKHSGFDTFVVDPMFDEIIPIKKRFLPRQVLKDGSATFEAIRGISHIRMGLNGEKAAVFHRKRRGIQIIDSYGEQVAYLDHPGKGMETKMRDDRGNPLIINIQADVAVNDRDGYALISDIVTDVFWLVDFNNQLFAKADLPFPVYTIKLAPNYIYLFGRDGHFGRFHYPAKANGEPVKPGEDLDL